MRSVDVCLTPELLHLYGVSGKTVVVIDILRATSCMVTAMAHGVKEIIPVIGVDECRKLQQSGCIGAGERDGKRLDGFEIGNSPFSYMEAEVKERTVAMTTTNGTLAIRRSRDAERILIGSFLNISAVVEVLKAQEHDVLLLCAGWKGKANLEDTLFAGAVVDLLKGDFNIEHDSALMAHVLYEQTKDDMMGFLQQSSHVRRLGRLDIQKDIDFCLQRDVYAEVPVLDGEVIVKLDVNAANATTQAGTKTRSLRPSA